MAPRQHEEISFFAPVRRRPGKGSPVDDGPRDSSWVNEIVPLVPMSGRVRYLLRVKRERCVHCPSGVRTVSIWVTPHGKGEAVAWCGHCFNASCEPYALDEEHRTRFAPIRERVLEGAGAAPWSAARPALEDLERRGII